MTEHKPREYTEGDARVRICYDPHGKRTHGYGHWGHEYTETLFAYKGNTPIFRMSLHRGTYAGYIKAITHAIAIKELSPITDQNTRITYWLKGATWQRKSGTDFYPILDEHKIY